MAGKDIPIDEVRDLLRYLEDQNDFFADPFSRAGMGSGMFNAEAFQPTREYVTNPTPYKNILMGMAEQNPDTLEGMIAEAIVNNGSPTSILVTLQNTEPEALKGIVPFTQPEGGVGDPVPDWNMASQVIDTHWKPYMEEQQALTDYQAEMDPQTGQLRYYTETPSKAAERFTDLGLPLPTDQYGDQFRGQGPSSFREQNGFDPMLQQLRGKIGGQRSAADRANNRYEQKLTSMMAPPEERDALARQLLGDANVSRPVQMGQMPSSSARTYADRAGDTGWTPESIALAQELGLAPQEIQDKIASGELDPAAGEVSGGGTDIHNGGAGMLHPFDIPGKVESGLGRAFNWIDNTVPGLNEMNPLWGGQVDGESASDLSPERQAKADWLTDAVPVLGGMMPQGSLDHLAGRRDDAAKKLQDLIAEQELLRNERASAYRDTVGLGSDAMQGASQAFAMEDSGRTPLTDVLDALARQQGVPSQFTPSYDPGSSGSQRATSKSSQQFKPKEQYVKADKENPRYKLNRALAFRRYLDG